MWKRDTDYGINTSGYVIHGAIHKASRKLSTRFTTSSICRGSKHAGSARSRGLEYETEGNPWFPSVTSFPFGDLPSLRLIKPSEPIPSVSMGPHPAAINRPLGAGSSCRDLGI